ncbi:Gfo/Idh/MocA family oxidoreductase [Bacillus sp. EB106-08-02-XG196]|uniref:Gfo/Idh/MocA family protein n=1 Tax=Bacillus sp. EB106-08-02-XG196 TaxID=2737049 RepID=UPI0015C45B42|nr:Gfo/Idh/MocA family oxidoreductase [Bacillus sp. EB106-08-02-XG196]NWQ43163.1 Gfo/Idh/MocA family oxidoreductase [Bacillus sp. EB106-08-02-XG196]
MLKVAVIGLGDISKIHIPAIQANPNVELVAVCDLDESLKGTVPGVNFYSDYHVMLEKENLDVVHNCLPHYLHYPVTRDCVEAGVKNVFQEKPLGLNTEEGKALVKLEEDHSDVKIGVCLQNRYNESFEMLQEIVKSGEYGQVTGVKGLVAWYRPKAYYDVKPWRGKMEFAGGGSMINQALHTLDLIQLMGGKMESIRGSVDQLLDYGIEVEDTASAHILFRNGARGLFFSTNANAENSSVELEVYLEKGKFIIKDSILSKINEEGKKEELVEDAKLPGSKFYYGASHAKTINQFYNCILQDSDDYVHAQDALVSIQMIDAIRLSSETKQTIKMEG